MGSAVSFVVGDSGNIENCAHFTWRVFFVYLNLSVAMRHVDPKLLEVGRLYRLNSYQMVRRLILPAVLPEYIVGLRSGLGLAWMFVVAAELLGASSGLGISWSMAR